MIEIEHWPLDRLIPYARNPRKNEHVVEKQASLIREFGFRVPIVALSDGTIVDGHLRHKAAVKLGLDTIPVVLADDLTQAQVKALRLSLNKSAEFADWDMELLKLEFDDLNLMDFDLSLTGFELDDMTGFDGDIPAESSTKEIDPDDYQLGHKCPRCGFEFNDD